MAVSTLVRASASTHHGCFLVLQRPWPALEARKKLVYLQGKSAVPLVVLNLCTWEDGAEASPATGDFSGDVVVFSSLYYHLSSHCSSAVVAC